MLSASREFQIMKVARPSMEFFSLLRLIFVRELFSTRFPLSCRKTCEFIEALVRPGIR